MTIAAGPRLQAAETLIARFAAAGRPGREKDAAAARKKAELLQRSPVGWHATRDALVLALRRRLSGKDLPRQLVAMRHGGESDMTSWRTSLYTVSWGNESTPLQNPCLGHLAGRIYGGFAFSRFR